LIRSIKIECIVTLKSRAVEVAHSNQPRIAMYCQFYILWLSEPSTRQSLHQATSVIFNRGSANPHGSASICQEFRSSSVNNKNNLACEITSEKAIKVLCTECLVPN